MIAYGLSFYNIYVYSTIITVNDFIFTFFILLRCDLVGMFLSRLRVPSIT